MRTAIELELGGMRITIQTDDKPTAPITVEDRPMLKAKPKAKKRKRATKAEMAARRAGTEVQADEPVKVRSRLFSPSK